MWGTHVVASYAAIENLSLDFETYMSSMTCCRILLEKLHTICLLLFWAKYGRSMFFTYLTALTVPSPKMGPVSLHTLVAHETPILSSRKQSSWISPRFSALQCRLFWKFTANVRKPRPHPIETLSIDLVHCAQDWRNQFQKRILAAGFYSIKTGTAVLICGRSCDNCVALRADVFATLIAWASRFRDFLGEVSIIGQISSQFLFCQYSWFQSGFLSSSDPFIFRFPNHVVCT
jgi:hypothetical protein